MNEVQVRIHLLAHPLHQPHRAVKLGLPGCSVLIRAYVSQHSCVQCSSACPIRTDIRF